MSNPISIQIHGDNPDRISHGEIKKGTVRIKSRTEWECTQISAKLVYESKGKLSPSKKVIDEYRLVGPDTILFPGEVYEYDFELKQHDTSETYKGENVSVNFHIEVEAILGGKEDNSGLLDKISNVLAGQRRIKARKRLQAQNKGRHVISEKYDSSLSLGTTNMLTLIIVLLLCLLTAVAYVKLSTEKPTGSLLGWIIGGLIVNILLGIGIQKLLVRSFIGRFRMFLQENGDDSFFITIESQKAWQLVRAAYCNYQVVEKVVDTRGTSDSTYRSTYFASVTHAVEQDHFGESKLSFNYPDPPIPEIDIDDVSLEWEVTLELKIFLGLWLTYTGDFQVDKEAINN
jgi:hypothetical protein